MEIELDNKKTIIIKADQPGLQVIYEEEKNE